MQFGDVRYKKERRRMEETTEPKRNASELLAQFLLDIPRSTLYLNNQLYSKDTTSLFMNLWNIFTNANESPDKSKEEKENIDDCLEKNTKAFRNIEFCTQSALAPYFQVAQKRWCREEDVHVLDGGKQIIQINTLKNIWISSEKPFRIVKIGIKGEIVDEKTVTLRLLYEHTKDEIQSEWIFNDEPERIPELVDWVFV
eukprot:augustus_masked-scaffold_10-processed-gene-13.54-mRNA-1 protein AED:1.00 eAED:1.00 QI:0/-1/0/0/-1/1/1/0/197